MVLIWSALVAGGLGVTAKWRIFFGFFVLKALP
jgi:hypothetical protein